MHRHKHIQGSSFVLLGNRPEKLRTSDGFAIGYPVLRGPWVAKGKSLCELVSRFLLAAVILAPKLGESVNEMHALRTGENSGPNPRRELYYGELDPCNFLVASLSGISQRVVLRRGKP
ncbi:hypothetical protein EVAR_68514_1 [Eumeta japonica]|uniref:Uncharacterized protein n=1 Tax=Eumeta variegata TaxID=151549 RepID=A0A4C1ZHE4_EUMVA|nr:hypothetical protein EVAR_68514_1 [Eumeta japonica]